MTDHLKEHQSAKLDEAVKLLSEYFDTVQILVTSIEDDGSGATWHFARGHGNLYARTECCREFCIQADERAKRETLEEG
jgi:hypothetical protein